MNQPVGSVANQPTATGGPDRVPALTTRRTRLESRYPRWSPRRLDEHLDAVAAEFPDRPYVITDERSWTYRDVRDWSIQIARGLVAAGIRPGEHVAVVLANFPEFVAVKYGISRAGATCVPVNFFNRRDELAYVLDQSDAVALITMDSFRGLDYLTMLDELAPGWEQHGGGERLPKLRTVAVFPTSGDQVRDGAPTLSELASDSETASAWQPTQPITEVGPDAAADILYTSGTTGQPKGVLLTHDMLLRTAYGSAYSRAFDDAHRILFALPMYHVFGYVEGMLAATFTGGATVPQLTFDAASTVSAIERHRVTDALLIPLMSMAVLDELDRTRAAGRAADLSSLTHLLASGGTPPTGLWHRIEQAFAGVEITTGYGMSETTASTTVTRPDDPPRRRLVTNGRLRDVGVAGDPALGGRLVEYRVVDPVTRAPLERGEVGELIARGPGVTTGYYRKPDETATAFADGEGWLRTGDLGSLDADDYLTLVGRVKESYRCGGEQVMPKEVEDVLTAHPSVSQAFVVPLADERMGEVGVAWIVGAETTEHAETELIEYCAARLARFKVPRHVLPIAEADVPTTPSGRPRKFLLARRAAEQLGAKR
jgi:fatty-acyl-CoA synthase